MDSPSWTHRPPSPPSTFSPNSSHFPSSRPGPSSRASPNPNLALVETTLSLSALSLPLGAPLSHPPAPDTPDPSTHHGTITISTGAAGVLSPPTPAPSPTPRARWPNFSYSKDVVGMDEDEDDKMGFEDSWKRKARSQDPDELMRQFQGLNNSERFAFLSNLVGELRLNEALVVSRRIEPRLRRDFFRELPLELALHCLSFVDEARTLARSAQVSRYWNQLLQDEQTWKDLCDRHRFTAIQSSVQALSTQTRGSRPGFSAFETGSPMVFGMPIRSFSASPRDFRASSLQGDRRGFVESSPALGDVSFKQHFKNAYLTESNWLSGGRLLANHTSADDGVVTSLAIDEQYFVIGMANSKIHIFDARTGAFRRSLIGHELGVWALVLVHPSRPSPPTPVYEEESFARMPRAPGAYRDGGQSRRASFNGPAPVQLVPTQGSGNSFIARPSTALGFGARRAPIKGAIMPQRMKQSDVCGSARGWGNKRPLVVSGGCDREVKVWDAETGEQIHSLHGHSSTIRCLKVLDGRPIAVSGSRDWSLRVWDIERGILIHTLTGHEQSVRCIEIAGNQVVSGSYDFTCRLWNTDTGECIHVLRGHYHQIYAVAFDGERIVTGSLDSTVRVWSAATGDCLVLLQGHTSLVGQLQLTNDRLVTGGSDGRVIIFNLSTLECIHRLCAHDNSVTCLQFDERFIVSGGNDGRVKLWDTRTGTFIRELTRPCDAVWRVAFKEDKCVILCQRGGKTVLEVLNFRAGEEAGRRLRV